MANSDRWESTYQNTPSKINLSMAFSSWFWNIIFNLDNRQKYREIYFESNFNSNWNQVSCNDFNWFRDPKNAFRLQHQLHMLNVYVCLNSQHSRWRLRALFNSTHGLEENISIFYGNYFNSNKDVKLTHFNYIDLDDFFAHTAPELVVLRVSQFSAMLTVYFRCTSGRMFLYFSVDSTWRNVHKQNVDWHDMVTAIITISGIEKRRKMLKKWLFGVKGKIKRSFQWKHLNSWTTIKFNILWCIQQNWHNNWSIAICRWNDFILLFRAPRKTFLNF